MLNTARLLLAVTILYNLAEGVIAIWSGAMAGSLALVSFGADSYLEVAAASLVLWRLGITDSERAEKIEQRIIRFIGWSFIVLAAAVIFQSGWDIVNRDGAEESVIGISLAVASIIIMPALAIYKLRIAAKGNLLSIASEAKETIACSYLSLTLLVGLVANALFGWWWLDAITALLLVPWLIKEGLEGIRGECCVDGFTLCSCGSCLYGLRDCKAACCAV